MTGRGGDRAALRVYAPRGLLAGRDGRASHEVAAWQGHGAVLLADLSGFTRLTAQLGGAGRSGAEQLTGFLDRAFGPLVDEISGRGGDVVAFAGDSVLAVWEDAREGSERSTEVATACALDGLARHRALRDSGLFIPMRIAVGSGPLRRLELGGEGGRWVHIAAGEAIEEALRADALRHGDRVMLAPGSRKRLGSRLVGEPLGEYFAAMALCDASADATAAHAEPFPGSAEGFEGFVPEAVIQRLGAGDPQFVAEFRNVTSTFLALDPLLAHELAQIQEVVATAQRCIRRFEGTLHQLVQDDKGLTLVATFGVPPRSHDDDPARGVECASELLELLGNVGVRTRAAVSTGLVYCGDYGGVTRRQYGVIGESMNRAAHLVANAEVGAVMCDAETQSRARAHRHFVALPGQQLKGGHEVRPYLTGATWTGGPQPSPELVGRPALRRAIATWLDRLAEVDDRPPILVLEGEAGIGKTTVLSDLHRRARDAGIAVVWSQGEAIRARASYAPVRALVRTLHGSGLRPPGARGLLSAVLPEHFEPDPAIESLAPQTRLEELIELLRKWIREATRERALLWIVEDAHWVDSASQSVIASLAGSAARFGIVLGRRPFAGSEASLRQAPRESIAIEPLSRAEIAEVLVARLRVSSIPEPLLDVIHRRAAGNPLFAEELAGVLVERGELEIAQGQCRLRASLREIEHVSAPPSLERLITTRIDRLEQLDQLVLKAASVLGQRFELALLRRVCVDADAPSLDTRLERLVSAGFFQPPAPDGRVSFRHPLFQEITYGLLVASQRRLLHHRAAEALEDAPEAERARVLARLALHWEQAGDTVRALPLLTRAADEALRSHANEESIDLYERALAARRAADSQSAIDLEVARIERNIGAAHASQTRHAQAREHYQRSIQACGYAISRGRSSTARALAVHLLHRGRRALTGHGARALHGDERARAMAAIVSQAGLAPVELWLGNQGGYALLALQIANLGDQLEPSSMSAGGATSLGFLLGMTPLRRLAEGELRRGLAGAIASADAELRVLCGVLLGMFLTATGRPHEAIEVLRPASEAGAALVAGPWRHRSRFQLAEALLMRGEYAGAIARFDEAAELARHGEPHVVGFANSLGALARLRLGQEREALALLLGHDGVEGTRRNESRLPLFASLGALVEICTASGREPERGAAAAREAESLAGDWSDTATYFAGYFGHCGLLEWWVDQLERGDASAEPHVAKGLRRLRRFAKRYPAAWPRLRLFEARHEAATGRRRRARRRLRASAAIAQRFGLDRELDEARRRLDALSAAGGGAR